METADINQYDPYKGEMHLDFWYTELLYYQTAEVLELRPRGEPVSRPTPVLKGLQAISQFTENKPCKRKYDTEEIIYEAEEGEFDNRLDGAYWQICSSKRRRK